MKMNKTRLKNSKTKWFKASRLSRKRRKALKIHSQRRSVRHVRMYLLGRGMALRRNDTLRGNEKGFQTPGGAYLSPLGLRLLSIMGCDLDKTPMGKELG